MDRSINAPFRALKSELLDSLAACVPSAIGIRATEADYVALMDHVREVAAAFDAWGNAVLSEAKQRAPMFGGSDRLGPAFTNAINEPFGLIEQLDTLRIGAEQDALDGHPGFSEAAE